MSLRSVMVVDDEPDIRTLVTLILERLGGLTVYAMPSGMAALDSLRAGTRPDMIILDVMMPVMDGLQTLEAVRQMPDLVHLPVCLFTAKVHPSELLGWQQLSICDVLAKPFEPTKLLGQILESWEKCQKT